MTTTAGKTLTEIEAQLDALAASLLAGAPESIEHFGTALHRAALSLGKLRKGDLSPPSQARLVQCATRLGQIRTHLSRRAALVERELATLLPQAKPATYKALNPAIAGRRGGGYAAY